MKLWFAERSTSNKYPSWSWKSVMSVPLFVRLNAQSHRNGSTIARNSYECFLSHEIMSLIRALSGQSSARCCDLWAYCSRDNRIQSSRLQSPSRFRLSICRPSNCPVSIVCTSRSVNNAKLFQYQETRAIWSMNEMFEVISVESLSGNLLNNAQFVKRPVWSAPILGGAFVGLLDVNRRHRRHVSATDFKTLVQWRTNSSSRIEEKNERYMYASSVFLRSLRD